MSLLLLFGGSDSGSPAPSPEPDSVAEAAYVVRVAASGEPHDLAVAVVDASIAEMVAVKATAGRVADLVVRVVGEGEQADSTIAFLDGWP